MAEPIQNKKIKELYDLIEGIQVAMFTTRNRDGRLVSRPMATQTQAQGADLWFVTDRETHKLDDLEHDPNVNLSYYKDGSREWVSVSGNAYVSDDRESIRELYRPDWKIWMGDEGGERDGGPEDPRLALIMVEVESVTYMKLDKPRPVILFEMAKGLLTGKRAEIAEVREVSGSEIRSATSVK